ncbi:MAG: hypothetical protein OP8BY_1400 [Candidatus Saccharicenans subterraneus]|uniref:Uncharacterized protein n=1 Tax=Candidatus Saccharicenans subterraneus TaxID=2508984 RepID=A0A3E2BQ70_9BACT|nr:MAG: hypothetical protein OP8BY_1400 [Candidatus Saccharicenans subterraneum]
MIRPLLSLERLLIYEREGKVGYRSHTDPLDWIPCLSRKEDFS